MILKSHFRGVIISIIYYLFIIIYYLSIIIYLLFTFSLTQMTNVSELVILLTIFVEEIFKAKQMFGGDSKSSL